MRRIITFLKDVFLNVFFGHKYKLFYIAENYNWVIDEEGKAIIKYLSNEGLVRGKVTSTPIGLRNKILHFGSIGTLVTSKGVKDFHKSNKAILSWFHIVEDDKRIKFIPDLNNKISFFHTASNITKNKLVGFGADTSKIKIIPLGVDLSVFCPNKNKRDEIRQKLKISEQDLVIGSFQKDGDGWGEGLAPKLIKGPDLFCEAVRILSVDYPVHVILTGPARGYVKKKLESFNIKYSHIFLKDAKEVSSYYNALDYYLICSREEGGPKALLESMASGIPVISTEVGMSPDVIDNGVDGFVVKDFDVKEIALKVKSLISNSSLRDSLIDHALEKIKDYSSQKLSKRFYYDIYQNLLE